MLPLFNSLYDLTEYFSSEDDCLNYLENIRWGKKQECPHCYHDKLYKLQGKNKRFKCAKCRKQFSVKVGTIFEDTKVELKKWFIAIYLHSSHKKGISSIQLGKDIGVTQKTAWFMLQRIRYALEDDSPEQLTDTIEVDETYVGGKNKNRHKDKKVPFSQGRSYKDKTPVFGMIQRGGKVMARVVPDVKGNTLKKIIFEKVKQGACINSDEWFAYTGLSRWYKHRVVCHGKKQYVDGENHTNTIEGFWSHLKRGIFGVYHWVSRKHLQGYVNEFVFRYNTRLLSEYGKFNMVLSSSIGKRLKYQNLIE